MDPRFFESWFNRRHKVLGSRLRPFSLWHCAVLDFAGSPVITASGVPQDLTPDELWLATEVCRTRVGGWLGPLRQFFGGHVDLKLPRLRRWGWRHRRAQWLAASDFEKELAAFKSYLKDYCSGPLVLESEKSRRLKSPWVLLLVGRLMVLGKMNLLQAWSCPVGHAFWWSPAFMEASGHEVNIMGEADLKAAREAGHDL